MRTPTIGLVLAILASLVPVASAGTIFCPTFNPAAATNVCLKADVITQPLRHPGVGGPAPYCIIGPYCVDLPSTTVTTTNVPDVTLCGTYVWVNGFGYVVYYPPTPCKGIVTGTANSIQWEALFASSSLA